MSGAVTPVVCLAVDHVEFRRIPDDECDLSWLEQTDDAMGEGFEAQATERLAAYEQGEWEMIGVTAALIDPQGREIDESPGLWGIESDSGQGHLDDVAGEELAYLATLHGLTADQLSALPTMWVER